MDETDPSIITALKIANVEAEIAAKTSARAALNPNDPMFAGEDHGLAVDLIALQGHLFDLRKMAASLPRSPNFIYADPPGPLPYYGDGSRIWPSATDHPGIAGRETVIPENPSASSSAWPALIGLEAYHSARFGVEGTLGASACPEVRGLLLDRKGDCAWLLTLEGVVPVPAAGRRFADPAAAWDRVRRFVSGAEPEPEQVIEAT